MNLTMRFYSSISLRLIFLLSERARKTIIRERADSFNLGRLLIMEIVDLAVRIALVVATTVLFGIIFLAYLRARNRKMLLISIGFGIFFVHALITIPELFNEAYKIALGENAHLLFHLIGLIFILAGILKD